MTQIHESPPLLELVLRCAPPSTKRGRDALDRWLSEALSRCILATVELTQRDGEGEIESTYKIFDVEARHFCIMSWMRLSALNDG